jgi:hypothetical protein
MPIRRLAVAGLVFLFLFNLSLIAQTVDLQSAKQAASHDKMPPRMFAAMPLPPKPTPAPTSDGPDPDRHWEFEVHGGGAFVTNPGGGSAFGTPVSTPFTAAGGGQTAAISSYMFGDGAALFNTVITNGGAVGTTLITPLDPVLHSPFAERQMGGGFGGRLSYDLNQRWGLEFNADYNFSPLDITSPSLAGVEATRASWQAAHADNFTNGCGCVNTVTATSSFVPSEGSQTLLTGAVNINLVTGHRLVPYVTLGAGALLNNGDNPSATILGTYEVAIGTNYDGTDLVTVQARPANVQVVGLAGFGLKYYVTPHWGLRFDFRDHFTGNGQETFLSATPSHTNIPGSGPVGPGGDPTIQFSNDTTLGQDTLSGPPLTSFRTFSGDGVRNHMSVTGGIFFRF